MATWLKSIVQMALHPQENPYPWAPKLLSIWSNPLIRNDGDHFQGFDAFAAKLAKDTLDYAWNMMWAFSVDDDADSPGDWVHAGFDEVGTFRGDTVEKAVIEEWYLIQDKKVQYYSNSKRLQP